VARVGPSLAVLLSALYAVAPVRAQDEPDDESESESEAEAESESESESEAETESESEGESESESESESEGEVVDVGEETVEIREERPKEGATAEVVERDEIETFPHRDAEDLLRLSPGMHLSAHGGRGKAYQIFVRGFDAVHGSDVAASLEGIPLNEASHIHGQGYLDLHFLPPEAVLSLDLAKGAVRADRGDFAIAASADYRVGLAEPGLRLGIGGGTDRSLRAMTSFRPQDAREDTFVVGDAEWAEGVGERRGHRAARFLGGFGTDLGDARLRFLGAAYTGQFESPGVLRQDDLDAERVGFYDSYLDTDGGTSRRLLGAGILDLPGMWDRFGLLAWVGWRQLALTHNFTGWSYHPDHGDTRRQEQESVSWGVTARYSRGFLFAQDATTVEAGVSVRGDHLTQQERGLDPDGSPWVAYADADITQINPGAWLQADVGLFSRVRLVPAIRLDVFSWRITDRLDEAGLERADPAAAEAHAWTLSPKAAAEITVVDGWRWYASYGRGFRSPPVRGLDDGDVAPVGKADTVELGTHLFRVRWLDVRGAFFYTFVANEIVFDHVAAKFLASGSTRRLGGELVLAVRPLRWLRVEADVTYADGRYTATGEPIPYAPRLLVAGGVYVDHAWTARRKLAAADRPGTPCSVSAGLRSWVLGPRPLTDGQRSHTAWVTDLVAGLALGPVFVELHVDNLFAQEWRDGEFVFPSCFDPTKPCSALPVRHVTAGTPWALRALVGVRL